MKKYILISLASALVYLSITSYSNGPANSAGLNCTGSYGAQASCDGGGCHGPNDANVTVDITVRDLFGTVLTGAQYFPGAVYWIIVDGHKFGGTYPTFSFQFCATSEKGPTGGIYTPTSGLHSSVAGSAIIIEPDFPLATTSVGTANNFRDSFLWTAPPKASWGKWTLYVTALVSNNDNTKAGDAANNYQRTFIPITASVGSLDDVADINVFPNPVRNMLHWTLTDAEPGLYSFIIYNLQGQIVYKEQKQINANEFKETVNAAAWPAGNYQLEIKKDDKRKVVPVLKL